MDYDNPQQTITTLDNIVFFSNFDSGNLAKVFKTSLNEYELHISPDAASIGCNSYRSWFHFGILGLTKGTRIKLSLVNLTYMRVFANPSYKPVYRSLPSQSEWRRVDSDTLFEATYTVYHKYTWTFEVPFSDNEVYFAYAPAYSYSEISVSISNAMSLAADDCYFYKETLTKSIDGNAVELITFSNQQNFYETPEPNLEDLFFDKPRCLASKKPIVFISSRVHPGETPASFLLESLLLFLTSSDPRACSLRNAFVFKIIPVLNPDGVVRGNFRVDQNGINLNRCYEYPDESLQPTIFAVKSYFKYLSGNIKYYFDLHAHASKRSCFLFGNFLDPDKLTETQTLAKLIDINSGYFDFNECDFSEKSMTAKDPKDHHSKEGSGRVNFFKSFGVLHSYTVECSYFIPRLLHSTPSPLYIKTVKRTLDVPVFERYAVNVHNRMMYNEIAVGIGAALLDYEKINPCSKLPLSEYRFLETVRDWAKSRILFKVKQSKRPTRTAQKCSSNRARTTIKSDFISGGRVRNIVLKSSPQKL